MLRKLRARLTYANVMSTVAVFVAVGTGGAYAANTVFSTDIVDGQVKSADVKDQSLTTFDVSTFLGADLVDNTLTSRQLATDSVWSAEVTNGGLIDRDVGQTVARNFAGNIGVVNSQSCVNRTVTGGFLKSNHMLLTPSIVDSDPLLQYTALYNSDPAVEAAYIHVCNWTGASINDGTTHFNLLSFNGYSGG